MAQARQRMQEKHEQLSREYEERMKRKRKKKQEEKLAAMESLVHGKHLQDVVVLAVEDEVKDPCNCTINLEGNEELLDGQVT
ncbi:hypothetical protein CEXT_768291 [Caerostris extrusa]|uniref:Uncharacterized protein n=1 Tax=Caerostris extrusa TaxID=172846 RepID=A0AAV4NNA0_CAEEX|nr:hypothetical protein CEXT_768291 [Caerostris extrusa]